MEYHSKEKSTKNGMSFQGWANIEKLARTNIWIYSKKYNMRERIFKYLMIFISNIRIFVYWSFTCQNMTTDTWHRKPDMFHTGMWTLSQNFRSLALMVWELKILIKRMTNLISQSVTGVFVKRPWRHQMKTCSFVIVYSVERKSKILFSFIIPLIEVYGSAAN